jgi:hypothetical protein
MSKQVKFRRGTTAQHASFTGPSGEITVDTDKNQIVIHDGVTAGGVPIAREDRPRGYTTQTVITTTATPWTSTGKTDLKRIRVYCYGGGGGGGGTSGGGQGAQGYVEIPINSTVSVTVTIGSGGSSSSNGGTSSFGSYINSPGGAGGSGGTGGYGGTPSGTGVVNLGAASGTGNTVTTPGQSGAATVSSAWNGAATQGGGEGGGQQGTAAKGIKGSGGGGGANGAQGSVIVEEIYGFV